ncbi:unnamed protein product [Candida verbasci]|uniref:Ribosomal RNA-processing protein 14 n=1 Tax=Candida verbasci TaxID=1227364 RepID=A0A9W4XA48_9ASCO|nr:unnamed protein product [Candida verbasci]
MSNSLEERLKTHSSAFDGLLSLIPAKYYYDDATKDQWQQKKKSKQELKQNKKLKLDPNSKKNANELSNGHASAKDVMDNKAKNATKVNLPKLIHKKQEEDEDEEELEEEKEEEEEEEEIQSTSDSDESEESEENDINEETKSEEEDFINQNNNLVFDDDGNELESEKYEFKKESTQKNGKGNNKLVSPDEEQKRKENLAKLREKLESKINTLREKRKAVGTKVNGAPKSREQILAERKRKDETKKQQKRKHEELEEEEEEMDSDDDIDEEEDVKDNNILFGNIVFEDGTQMTSDLSKVRNSSDKKKLKGPANRDIKAHLQKLEKKKQKLSNLSPSEKAKQLEKDKWQRVMAQAEGIKLKDDEKLLKKSLKRKEKQKLKSEIEWKERKQFVKDSVAARAKKREENLKARKESKGLSKKAKKHQPKLKKFTGLINNKNGKKKRAGFEGSAKSKSKK